MALQPNETMTRQEIVSLTLRTCALSIDPRYGLLSEVAKAIKVHPMTLTYWINTGYVPAKAAKKLQDRFGRALVNRKLLSQKPVQA